MMQLDRLTLGRMAKELGFVYDGKWMIYSKSKIQELPCTGFICV